MWSSSRKRRNADEPMASLGRGHSPFDQCHSVFALVLSTGWPARSPGSQWHRVGPGTRVAGAQLPLLGSDGHLAGAWLVFAVPQPWLARPVPLEPAKPGCADRLHASRGHPVGTQIRRTPWNASLLEKAGPSGRWMMKLVVTLAATALLVAGVVACRNPSAVSESSRTEAGDTNLSRVVLEVSTIT